MVRQLVFLTTAVLAILGQPDVSTCGTLFSTDSKCQNDSAALLQVGASNGDSDEPVGPAGPKQQLIEMKAAVITSMNDWHSSRDLARISRVQNVTIAKNCIVQIFSAVPVFGKDETYVALVVEKNGDAYWDHPKRWMQPFDAFVMFCAGPDGSHKTQVIARGHSWVCPWPREEWQTKRFNVVLEDKHGTNLGTVVAEHDPKLLGQYQTMACVRDIFYSPDPKSLEPFSGVFKQWVEWMEWSSMHGLEHFLIYTFEGTDLAAVNLMKPYLDAGIASRVHFQFFPPTAGYRMGHLMNDCIYRAKNHAKWLATSVDVDEYMVFPGKVKFFHWNDILKEQGISEDKVASLEVKRVRFARARPESLEISSDHRVPTFDRAPKQVVKVDNVYRTSFHWLTEFKAGTEMIKVDPKLAVIHHYRAATGGINFATHVEYEQYNFSSDLSATVKDEGLRKEMPLLEAAIAKRFNIQVSSVKGFLKNLAFRRPPDGTTAAAQHKMW